MDIKLPAFKASLSDTGNSKAFIVPAKLRADHGVSDDEEYWVEIKLRSARE